MSRKNVKILLDIAGIMWYRLDTASLNNLIEKDRYPDIRYGIKLGSKNIGFGGKFYTFPYFLTFLLKRFLREKDGERENGDDPGEIRTE